MKQPDVEANVIRLHADLWKNKAMKVDEQRPTAKQFQAMYHFTPEGVLARAAVARQVIALGSYATVAKKLGVSAETIRRNYVKAMRIAAQVAPPISVEQLNAMGVEELLWRIEKTEREANRYMG